MLAIPVRPTGIGSIIVFLLVALGGCTSSVPYRTAKFEETPNCRTVFAQNDEITKGDGTISEGLAKSRCWLASLEEHIEYDLLTVEFDDQGWVQGTSDPVRPASDHIDALKGKLAALYDENQKNGISLIVYVHGWQHNAHPEDRDVVKFREFLGQIKVAEDGRTLSRNPGDLGRTNRVYDQSPAAGKGPRVVGIYVGWRGKSVLIPIVDAVSFWERKDTAEHVAGGSVRELFQELDFVRDCGRTGLNWANMRKRLSPSASLKEGTVGARNVRMLTIGHSFGGLVVYRALSSEFIGYAVRASSDEFVSRLGDLVIVVNPAFEGARYEPLHVAGRRIPGVKPNQLPALIIATSQTDWATKYAFPIARALNTAFESQPGAEYDATVKAVGHNDRYRTHTLASCDSTKPDSKCRASCSVAPTSEDKGLSRDREEILGETQEMRGLGERGLAEKRNYLCGGLELVTDQEQPRNNPYWVVSTTEEIMDGHNDIFNRRFVQFLRQMYFAVTQARLKNPSTHRCIR